MSNKLHFIPLLGIPLIGLIVASFLDLQIASGIYWQNNYFGILMSAFGELPLYFSISAFGGCFFYLGLKKTKIIFKIICWVLGIISLLIAIYYQGSHIISRNAFNIEDMWYVGYPVALLICGLGFVLGLFAGKKNDNNYLFNNLVVILIIGILLPVIMTSILKDIMLRPRYRFLIGDVVNLGNSYISVDDFINWWQQGKTLYSNLNVQFPNLSDIFKEEFASFPSGHTNATAGIVIILTYLGKINSRFIKYQVPLFYLGFIWTIIMGFSRMTVGAHFLSDVCFGALITFVCFLFIDFIFYSKKKEISELKKELKND